MHMNTELLSEGKRRIWTRVFLGFLVLFSGVCMFIMNLHYDTLTRYPYQDRRSREMIRKYLDKEEIEYLIEYSIAPNVFISFIAEDGFNIYHAAEYKQLSEFAWDQPPGLIVRMVEETRDVMDTETLIRYLNHYTYDELSAWLKGKDPYAEGTELVDNAGNPECYIGNGFTVSMRQPAGLLEADPTLTIGTVYVSPMLQEPLAALCDAAESAFPEGNGCGFMKIYRGYVSYDEQTALYEEGKTAILPGQDDHQLGYEVDLCVEGLDDEFFVRTEQAEWLKENAYRYGFLLSRDTEPFHLRYAGKELAAQLHESDMTFDEYGALRQNDIEH